MIGCPALYISSLWIDYLIDIIFLSQALVKLFLDLHEKHNVGLINAEVRMEDVTSTIELLVTNLSECSALLELQPQFKRQLDSFDKVGWAVKVPKVG